MHDCASALLLLGYSPSLLSSKNLFVVGYPSLLSLILSSTPSLVSEIFSSLALVCWFIYGFPFAYLTFFLYSSNSCFLDLLWRFVWITCSSCLQMHNVHYFSLYLMNIIDLGCIVSMLVLRASGKMVALEAQSFSFRSMIVLLCCSEH